MLNTKEHYDLMEQFEREFRAAVYGVRFEKESKDLWPKGVIYQHGATNDLFLAFRRGYSVGKCAQRLEA